jgi:hypothetical protein
MTLRSPLVSVFFISINIQAKWIADAAGAKCMHHKHAIGPGEKFQVVNLKFVILKIPLGDLKVIFQVQVNGSGVACTQALKGLATVVAGLLIVSILF